MGCGRLRAFGNAIARNSILPRGVRKRLFLINFTAPHCHPNPAAAASVGVEGNTSIEHFR
jgi:hypothetical protein